LSRPLRKTVTLRHRLRARDSGDKLQTAAAWWLPAPADRL
jgi:hypothetical protein